MNADERFVEWYRVEHARVVSALTVATGDRDIARDAADEAFARALERWHRVGEMAAPTAWAYQVALNVARRRFRRRSVERGLHRRQHVPPHVDIEPLDHELWQAVDQLPPRQRTAVALRYVADLPERVIADAMQISPGTVSATLHTARKRLEAALTAAEHHQGARRD